MTPLEIGTLARYNQDSIRRQPKLTGILLLVTSPKSETNQLVCVHVVKGDIAAPGCPAGADYTEWSSCIEPVVFKNEKALELFYALLGVKSPKAPP